MVDTSDGGSITVTGNSNVTVGGTRWTGNVTIGAGSALSLSQVDFKSSDIILDGTFNLGVCGIDSGGNGARLVFGIGGIMNVNQKYGGLRTSPFPVRWPPHPRIWLRENSSLLPAR